MEQHDEDFAGVGATSRDGFRSKKPKGLSQKLTVSAGMIGQSSGRVMWWMPKVYQSTTSVFSIERFAAVHAGRPMPPPPWFTNSPAGQRSSRSFGVTHSVCSMARQRSRIGDAESNMAGTFADATSLYAGETPIPVFTLSLTTFHDRCVA